MLFWNLEAFVLRTVYQPIYCLSDLQLFYLIFWVLYTFLTLITDTVGKSVRCLFILLSLVLSETLKPQAIPLSSCSFLNYCCLSTQPFFDFLLKWFSLSPGTLRVSDTTLRSSFNPAWPDFLHNRWYRFIITIKLVEILFSKYYFLKRLSLYF